MNTARYLLASIAVFIFIFVFEWIFHGMFLEGIYMATANLWRTEEAMQELFYIMIVGQLLLALMFCFIFTRGYENRGIGEGVRYGLYVGLLFAGPTLVMYAVAPYPINMVLYWIIGAIIEFILAGVITAALYKRA